MKFLLLVITAASAIGWFAVLAAAAASRARDRAALARTQRTLDAIEEKADLYRDIDSVLAANVRDILRHHRATTRKPIP